MSPSAKLDFQPIGWRQRVVLDQAFLIRRNIKQPPSILCMKKLSSGHRFTPLVRAGWPILCPKTDDSVQGQNTLSTNYLDRLSNSSDISDILFGRH